MNVELNKVPTEDEVHSIVTSMDSDSALGPDGFGRVLL